MVTHYQSSGVIIDATPAPADLRIATLEFAQEYYKEGLARNEGKYTAGGDNVVKTGQARSKLSGTVPSPP